MIILGLTGSIGMGKTTTAGLFAKQGVPVFDADAAVHRLYQNDKATIRAVAQRFAGVQRRKKIDRKALAALVRKQPGALHDLENIVHPAVARRRAQWLRRKEKNGHRLVVFDIPLLLESGTRASVDKIIVVSATQEIQSQRVLSRPGMTRSHFEHLLSRQMPDQEKRKHADFVIDTSKGLEDTTRQVLGILQQIRQTADGQAPVLKGNNVP